MAVLRECMHVWAVADDSCTPRGVPVFHSGDFGVTWEEQNAVTSRDFYDVAFADSLTGWVCGAIGAILATSDGGSTWVRQNLGGPKWSYRIRCDGPRRVWSTGFGPLLMWSASGGDTWNMHWYGYPPFHGNGLVFRGMSFVDEGLGWLVAGNPDTSYQYPHGQGYIVRCLPSGDSLTLCRVDSTLDFSDVATIDCSTACVVGGNGRDWSPMVLRTTDCGGMWWAIGLPSGSRFLRSVCFVDERNGWACGNSGTILHTTDGGLSWALQQSPTSDTLFDVEFADTLRGMIAGESAVLRTLDGQTWTRAFPGVAEGRQTAVVLPRSGPTLARSALMLSGRQEAELHDISGRRVMDLHPGQNDIRSISPGIYFTRREEDNTTTKVVIQR